MDAHQSVERKLAEKAAPVPGGACSEPSLQVHLNWVMDREPPSQVGVREACRDPASGCPRVWADPEALPPRRRGAPQHLPSVELAATPAQARLVLSPLPVSVAPLGYTGQGDGSREWVEWGPPKVTTTF